MSLEMCPIQHCCPKYSNGTKHRDEYARATIVCNVFLDMTCEKGVDLQMFIDGTDGISCDLEKMRRVRNEMRTTG